MATVTYKVYPTLTWQNEGPGLNDVAQARWTIPDGPDLWLLQVCTRYYRTGATAHERPLWEAWDGDDLLFRAPTVTFPGPNEWGTYQCKPSAFWDYAGGLMTYAVFNSICPWMSLSSGHQLCFRSLDFDSAGDIFEPWMVQFWYEDAAPAKKPTKPVPKPVPPYRCKLIAR